MFRSYTYISTSNQKEKAVYKIIDSDFGKIVTLGNGYIVGVGIATAIVAEYGKRNLDIGKILRCCVCI